MVVYVDSSFANNVDLTSRMRLANLLLNNHNRAIWLHFTSYKCTNVVRFLLEGELYACAVCFDHA